MVENASFITVVDDKDLVVSFAISDVDDDWDVKSLTLLRTPKYEFALDESERGVTVSYDDFPEHDDELLKQIDIKNDIVTIRTTERTYTVSIKDVEKKEIEQAKKILHKMNFDNRFELTVA